jgi:ParB/RepB/Spo0J family partition protein
MNLLAPPRKWEILPLALIDRPELDARIERDDEFLSNLQASIAKDGILVPLIVVCVGERYEVVDGFTRYIVAKRLDLPTVPCCIYPTKELALEGVKYTATAFHQNFSPADEAIYFRQLLETECQGDVERLAALTNRKVNYVLDRLDLINGDEDVFKALSARGIGVGVAKQLNKISAEDYRRYYLQYAIRDGATESTVVGWVQQWKNMFEDLPPAPPSTQQAAPAIVSTAPDIHNCVVCKKSDPRFIPILVPVHQHCKLAILDVLLDNVTAPQPTTD